MRIDVVTLFPELFEVPLRTSILGRALRDGVIEIAVHDLRAFGLGRHRSVDDVPYGGGAGMVMRPEPLFAAVESLTTPEAHVVLMSPRGTTLTHAVGASLARRGHVVIVCGRYEGVDERVVEHLVDEEISIGDYVLGGGELPALVTIEVVARLVPGVVGNAASLESESYAHGVLEYPQYTRPAEFRGWAVPQVLVSGDHAAIERWRTERSLEVTRARRPDLMPPPDA